MKRFEKLKLIDGLKEVFENHSSAIVVHYKGLTVSQLEDLRKNLYKSDMGFKIIKNNLASIAVKDTNCGALDEFLVGPTAVAYGNDPVTMAKILSSFSEKNVAMSLVGGVFDGAKLTLADINTLSTLPSFDEIRGKLVGLLVAAATKLMVVSRTPATNTIGVFNAYAKK